MSETFNNKSIRNGRVEHRWRILPGNRAARKQADEALRHYELLSAYSRDIMLFVRPEDGRILEANKAAMQAYGYTREELLGLHIHDLRARETKESIGDQLAQADIEGILFESVHRRKDGSTFPVEVSSQGATISGVRALVSAVRDITKRRKAEEALRESRARFLAMVQAVPSLAFESDPEGNNTFASEQWCAYTGMAPEQTVGNGWDRALHPDDAQAVAARWSEARKAGSLFESKHRLRAADGSYRWFIARALPTRNAAGDIVRWTGSLTDVDDLVLTQQKLMEALQRLDSHMANSPLAVVEFDARFRVTRWSEEAQRLFGWTAEEIVGKAIGHMRWIHPEDADRVRRVSADLLCGKRPRCLSVNRNYRKDGSIAHCEWYNSAIYDARGQLISVLSLVLDVTQRKEAEQRLKEIQADLERSQAALSKANAELEQRVRERTIQLEDSILALEKEIAAKKKIEARIGQLSRVFMDAADPIIIEDLSGTIIEMNREAERAYGWSRDELIGKSVKSLFLPERYSRAMGLRERCRNGEELRNLEGIRRDKNGRTLNLLVTAFPLTGESGRIVAIATITKDITVRKRMETELKESRQRLMELSRKSIEALEADRRAVSRELHDSIGGSLAAIRYLLEETVENIPNMAQEAITSVTKAISYLTGTIKETKRISANLRPLTLDDLGLMATIEGHFKQFCEQYRDIAIVSEIAVREEDIPESLKIVVYRILQEALTNVARHSKAETVHVRLKKTNGGLSLEIEDNGCGFEIQGSSSRDPFSGYGLKSMQERAEICSGSFAIHSLPGRGTCVHLTLPLTGSPRADEDPDEAATQ